MIFNLFCDASIDTDKKTACGGCYIVAQYPNNRVEQINYSLIIQLNATNNSSEIMAIYAGICEALKLREQYPNAVFRLFSDSKISLYGLRDWMKNWLKNIREDGTLISSSGKPVMNQQRFIEIYNLIVRNELHIELYHQRGHVLDGKVSEERARVQFIRANKVTPEMLGLNTRYISECNDMIDNLTRTALYQYINCGTFMPNTRLEYEKPFIYYADPRYLHKYITCINKTSVNSRHDFKGGYSQ